MFTVIDRFQRSSYQTLFQRKSNVIPPLLQQVTEAVFQFQEDCDHVFDLYRQIHLETQH